MKPIMFLSLFFCISTTLFTMEREPNRMSIQFLIHPTNENEKNPYALECTKSYVFHMKLPTAKRKSETQSGETQARRFVPCWISNESSTSYKYTMYKCKFLNCSSYSQNEGNAIIHVCTHLDLKPYHCTIQGCNKSFASLSILHRHYHRTHPEHQAPKSTDYSDEFTRKLKEKTNPYIERLTKAIYKLDAQ